QPGVCGTPASPGIASLWPGVSLVPGVTASSTNFVCGYMLFAPQSAVPASPDEPDDPPDDEGLPLLDPEELPLPLDDPLELLEALTPDPLPPGEELEEQCARTGEIAKAATAARRRKRRLVIDKGTP